MPLLLLGIESWHVAIFIAFVGFIIVAMLTLDEPASARCRVCHDYVGHDYCIYCRGSGVREFVDGDRIVQKECKHHDWFVSMVVCHNCR